MTYRFKADGRHVMQNDPTVIVAICVDDVWAATVCELLNLSGAERIPPPVRFSHHARSEPLRVSARPAASAVSYPAPGDPADLPPRLTEQLKRCGRCHWEAMTEMRDCPECSTRLTCVAT